MRILCCTLAVTWRVNTRFMLHSGAAMTKLVNTHFMLPGRSLAPLDPRAQEDKMKAAAMKFVTMINMHAAHLVRAPIGRSRFFLSVPPRGLVPLEVLILYVRLQVFRGPPQTRWDAVARMPVVSRASAV